MPRLKGFQKLTTIDEALSRFSSRLQLKRLEAESIPVKDALWRVTAELIISPVNRPPSDRSAVDGYALKAKDTLEASQTNPITLSLTLTEPIERGYSREIWTGNTVPKGADTVVMREMTRRANSDVIIRAPLTSGANVAKKGEDAKKGETVLDRGVRLRPQELGLLAALEIQKVLVVKKPKVAVLPVGNELVELGNQALQDQTVEVNTIILSNMCAQLGATCFSLGITSDDKKDIAKKITDGLERADIIITTGGTSVGRHDLVVETIESMEGQSVIAHGIAMRPGMPTGLATLQGKPIFILSGNPVAAMIGFEMFSRPTIQRLLGVSGEERVKIRARLTRRVVGALGRRVFLRVKVSEKLGEKVAEPIRVKGSGMISTMTKANGFVVIPEDREGLETSEHVEVYLLD